MNYTDRSQGRDMLDMYCDIPHMYVSFCHRTRYSGRRSQKQIRERNRHQGHNRILQGMRRPWLPDHRSLLYSVYKRGSVHRRDHIQHIRTRTSREFSFHLRLVPSIHMVVGM